MSFFGLTSFGPESTIKSKLKNSDAFGLFTDEEFKTGFDKCALENNLCDRIKLEHTKQFLFYSLNISPLQSEIDVFVDTANKSLDEYITWEEALSIINKIRENNNQQSEKARNFKSYNNYYTDTFKHKRKEAEPYGAYKAPVTYNQHIGFYKFEEGRNLNDVHRPIVKCPETKFSEFMIRSGKQFL